MLGFKTWIDLEDYRDQNFGSFSLQLDSINKRLGLGLGLVDFGLSFGLVNITVTNIWHQSKLIGWHFSREYLYTKYWHLVSELDIITSSIPYLWWSPWVSLSTGRRFRTSFHDCKTWEKKQRNFVKLFNLKGNLHLLHVIVLKKILICV